MSRAITLALLIVAALAIRSRDINQPIVRFHPTRHYRSAVLARACYYDHAGGIPEWARNVANAGRAMQQAGEPPIMESIACGAYLALGHENVMIPRLLNVIIWVLGAIPLFALARRLTAEEGALIAVALYLFLPYGIIASRNFQPDQLMTVASVIAILALVRHHDQPTRSRFIVAAMAVSAAGLIKPMSVFLTVPVALVLARPLIMIAAGMIAPVLFYGYSAIAGSLVQDQMRMRFEPHLIPTPFFYDGLLRMISRVETIPLFLLALAAAFIASGRLTRRILAALFSGYALFAIAFTYHMPTHDYYHLPYLAVTALGVGALYSRFGARIPASATMVLCAIIAIAGSLIAWPQLRFDDAPAYARMYQEIGDLAGHDTHVIFLDPEYGYSMMYHAQISGDYWPNVDDLAAEAIDGRAAIDADARFVRDYEDSAPSYFIATDLDSLGQEKDLQAMLEKRATPIGVTDRYRVYKFNSP